VNAINSLPFCTTELILIGTAFMVLVMDFFISKNRQRNFFMINYIISRNNPESQGVKKEGEKMKIILDKKPKNPIIIEGFPGFGLVSTIACEFY